MTLLVFDHKGELFNLLYPLNMSFVKFELIFQIFKTLMITINHKFL